MLNRIRLDNRHLQLSARSKRYSTENLYATILLHVTQESIFYSFDV
jgi:hypothetical protein